MVVDGVVVTFCWVFETPANVFFGENRAKIGFLSKIGE
tara:strand:+ start:389 stop:502 length:114 start_codon:yes stop_codon:yes gene_type:complete